ncbi:MAG TPA: histidine phosphatase family protein [Candidatus Lumbricidophila sp.]|nr:histidine phosphatase family protein [Candidatus Lumbricidophila sp.]
MKTLVLVRHAKSDWGHPGLADHDRPLADRGIRDAPRMATRLAKRGTHPEWIVSSTALRAVQTAELFAQALGVDQDSISFERRLYAADPEDIVDVIREFDDHFDVVMVVGHNPEFTELATRFAGRDEQLSTCAVVECRFDVGTWAEVGRGAADVRVDRPGGADD